MKARKIRNLAILALIVSGCHSAPSDATIKQLSAVYADFLIAKRLNAGDSIATAKNIDSVLKRYDFSSIQEMTDKIKAVGDDPDKLRQLFDSTQRRLESFQNGKMTWPPVDKK
ncbi:MAG: hypothetical protein ABIR47_02700 [Candidatus Kapaibacterium sp.]